jgi:tetratricopeptide (TPR) repeat protein
MTGSIRQYNRNKYLAIRMRIRFFICCFVLQFFLSFGQDRIMDSLKLALKKTVNDTTRCNILSAMIDNENDDAVWPAYNEEVRKIAELNLKKASLPKHLYLFWQKQLAASYTNVGFIANRKGAIHNALDSYSMALKIQEEINDKKGIALTLNNLAFIYESQGSIEKALECYNKCLILFREIKYTYGIASALNNIGLIYYNHEELSTIGNEAANPKVRVEKAIDYYEKSLKFYEEGKDQRGRAYALNNLGKAYAFLKNGKKSLDYFTESLAIHTLNADKRGMAFALNNIGSLFYDQKKYNEAIDYGKKSLELSKEISNPETAKYAAKLLKDIYTVTQDFKNALEFEEIFISMRDSISNQQTKKASIKNQLKYEYEKRAAADSVKNAEEQKVKDAQLTAQNAQIKQERFQRYALLIGLVMVLGGLGFVVNRFRITRRQKRIIEMQKQRVDKAYEDLHGKNKEILGSIHYARRIQTALLPNENYVQKNFNRLMKNG